MNPDLLPDWWDPYSCQPYKIPAADKPRTGLSNLGEYLKVAATFLALSPFVAARYARPGVCAGGRDVHDFVGLSVTPDDERNDAIEDMVGEIGVRRLLFRVPCWEAAALDRYLRFMERFPECDFTVNVLQSRDSVAKPDVWRRQVETICAALGERASTFQIGNAINRSKWGCRHTGDWLNLMDEACGAIGENAVQLSPPSLRRVRGPTVRQPSWIALRAPVRRVRSGAKNTPARGHGQGIEPVWSSAVDHRDQLAAARHAAVDAELGASALDR